MTPKISVLRLLDEPPTHLPDVLEKAWQQRQTSYLLSLARRPKKNWTRELDFAHPLVLSSAPQFELILWVPSDSNTQLPEAIQAEQDYLLKAYAPLFETSQESRFEDYKSRLLAHIQTQESQLWHELQGEATTPGCAPPELGRALRELSYEHRGLEKGLTSLEQALKKAQRGQLLAKEREKLDLDFYHLLEHHLEREAQALYPAAQLLIEAGSYF